MNENKRGEERYRGLTLERPEQGIKQTLHYSRTNASEKNLQRKVINPSSSLYMF